MSEEQATPAEPSDHQPEAVSEGSVAKPASFGLQVLLFLRALRPKQWTKNGAVLAPLIFSGAARDPASLLPALAAVALFCCAAGSCYVFNDLLDLSRDRLHPKKRHRPLASGRLSTRGAGVTAGALLIVSLLGAFQLPPLFGWTLVIYVLNTSLYSVALKRVAILDVMAIAVGFVLRAVAGGAAIHVEVTPWLLVCTAFLALFLGFGKRRHELVALGGQGTRTSLADYDERVLDVILAVVTACTIMSYSLYTYLSPVQSSRWLMLTIPCVIYGIFRYLHLVYQDVAESPDRVLLEDHPLQIAIVLWLLIAGGVLYHPA